MTKPDARYFDDGVRYLDAADRQFSVVTTNRRQYDLVGVAIVVDYRQNRGPVESPQATPRAALKETGEPGCGGLGANVARATFIFMAPEVEQHGAGEFNARYFSCQIQLLK